MTRANAARAGDDEGLGVERSQDLSGQGARQARRAGAHKPGDAVDAEVAQRLRGGCGGEQVLDSAAVEAGPEQAFQRGVHVEQGVAQPIGQPGGLSCEVVVVAGQHRQFGEGLVVGADPAQGVGHRACCVGDDVRVAGVGLALPRVQIGDAAHRQPRHVGHVDAHVAGDRDRQRADRRRLITTTSTRPCSASVANTVRSAVSSLGSALSCTRLPAVFSAQAWCSDLPTSSPQNTANGTVWISSGSDNRSPSVVVASLPGHPRRQPRYEQTTQAGQVSISGRWRPPTTVTTPPQIINDRGNKSCRGRWPASPHWA
jgi:hypothetical protein